MTQNDFQSGFEEDMGLLRAASLNALQRDNENAAPNEGAKQVLAMAYVPKQEFEDIFTSFSDALDNGSLFKNLVLPFTGRKVGQR